MATAKKTAPVVVNLNEELIAKRVELIETRRSHAAGELVNLRALGRIRKDIARLKTKMSADKKASAAPVAEAPKEEEKK